MRHVNIVSAAQVLNEYLPERPSSTITSEESVRSCSSPGSYITKESAQDVSPHRARAVPTVLSDAYNCNAFSGLLRDAGGRTTRGLSHTVPERRKSSRFRSKRTDEVIVAAMYRGEQSMRHSTFFPNSPNGTEFRTLSGRGILVLVIHSIVIEVNFLSTRPNSSGSSQEVMFRNRTKWT